jgi:cell wall-associated NlpC family hydrolase
MRNLTNVRRRLIFFLTCLGLLALVIIIPYRTSLIRVGMLALWCLAWAGLMALAFRHRALRIALIVVTALSALVLVINNSRTPDSDALRRRFVERLRDYDGVRYIYGGENHRGVDCSGLVRAAMVRALVDHGFASLDSGMLRSAFTLWWHDTNAIQLGKGAGGLTLPIRDGSPMPMRAAQNLRPGDLAVTTSGSHVLAYLGDQRWIEADPDVARVQIVDLRTSHIADQEVSLVTWRWLR